MKVYELGKFINGNYSFVALFETPELAKKYCAGYKTLSDWVNRYHKLTATASDHYGECFLFEITERVVKTDKDV